MSGHAPPSYAVYTKAKATDEQMQQDAEWLHVPPEKLLATLHDLFDLELEMQLRKRAVLRNARR